MADQNYEIQLNLKVNDSELTNAERRIAALGGAGSGVGSRYRWIPDSHRDRMSAYSRIFSRNFGANRSSFLENVNEAYHRSYVFRRNFLGNMVTFSGMLRNLSNLGGVIGQLGRVAGSAIPILGKLGSVFGAILGIKVASFGLRGAGLVLGTRVLNGQSLGNAASDIMQMRMAEKGLGGNYPEAIRAATDISTQYGFSRVGMLNAINMFSGLNIGGRKLSFEEAVNMAQIAGKVSHLGGIPFERVNTNLQQILGQAVPSIRDIREMVGQAPFIGKLAMQMMDRRGIRGDYREWLKDKQNVIEVLNEFDKLVETSPVLKARGKIALAKQDFWIKLAGDLSPYWDTIAEANKKLYDWLGNKIVTWVQNIDVESLSKKFDSVIKDLNTFADALGGVASIISGISDFVSKLYNGLSIADIGQKMSDNRYGGYQYVLGTFGAPSYSLSYPSSVGIPGSKTAPSGYSLNKSNKWWGDRDMTYKDIIQEQNRLYESIASQFSLDSLSFSYAAGLAGIPADSIGASYQKFAPSFNANKLKFLSKVTRGSRVIGKRFNDATGAREDWTIPEYIGAQLNPQSIAEWYKSMGLITGGGNAGNMATQDELSDISKGARGLIINFNREIVNMPVNIDQVNDGTDLADRIRDSLYDVIVRGLNISLNNATGAI